MTILPAEDLERARRFYASVLGLKEIESGIPGHAKFEAGGGSWVMLYQRERTRAEHTVLEFVVEDAEPVVRELTERGVKFEQYDFEGLRTNDLGIAQLGTKHSAWFVDTEGNILSVST
jgi:predicted enzyme related to lactoylglutathione lyase